MEKNAEHDLGRGTVRYEGNSGQRYILQESAGLNGRRLATYRFLSEEEYQRYRQAGRDGLFMDSLERGHWLRIHQTGSRRNALQHMMSVIGADRYTGGEPYVDFAPAFFPILHRPAGGEAPRIATKGAADEC